MGRKIMLVDIDDTISVVGKRAKLITGKKPNYKKYFETCDQDQPNLTILELVKKMSVSYEIIFVSERPQSTREKTAQWVTTYFGKGFSKASIALANEEDYFNKQKEIISEPEVKKGILQALGLKPDDITLALDNDPKVISMWKKLGIKTIQVGA